MHARWTLAFVTLAACAPQLAKTDEPEVEKSLSDLDEKYEALAELDVLLDARHQLTIGRACYMHGGPPWGREAVDGLVNKGRADLLERALRAPSPEGRLYAALGLFRLGKLTWTQVAALAANESNVETCNGCQTERVPASDAIGTSEEERRVE